MFFRKNKNENATPSIVSMLLDHNNHSTTESSSPVSLPASSNEAVFETMKKLIKAHQNAFVESQIFPGIDMERGDTLGDIFKFLSSIPLTFGVDITKDYLKTENRTPGEFELSGESKGVFTRTRAKDGKIILQVFLSDDEYRKREGKSHYPVCVSLHPAAYIPILKEMQYDFIVFPPTDQSGALLIRKKEFEEAFGMSVDHTMPVKYHESISEMIKRNVNDFFALTDTDLKIAVISAVLYLLTKTSLAFIPSSNALQSESLGEQHIASFRQKGSPCVVPVFTDNNAALQYMNETSAIPSGNVMTMRPGVYILLLKDKVYDQIIINPEKGKFFTLSKNLFEETIEANLKEEESICNTITRSSQYTEAAEQGDAEAQYNLGVRYQAGDGVSRNIENAIEWYKKSAGQGFGPAQYNLACCYGMGAGVAADNKLAFDLCGRAAKQGYANAQYTFGGFFARGNGVPQNHETAVMWYTKAAEQNFATAQGELALCYEKGIGVPQSYEKAIEWMQKAAEQGDAVAQNNLSNYYFDGKITAKNLELSTMWLTKAAERGNAIAQSNLGLRYCKGDGVPQDYAKAIEWLASAARQDYATAQYTLGVCYMQGTGVEQNSNTAFGWVKRAAEQGHTEATKLLSKFHVEQG